MYRDNITYGTYFHFMLLQPIPDGMGQVAIPEAGKRTKELVKP
jgi:hypothetical protein